MLSKVEYPRRGFYHIFGMNKRTSIVEIMWLLLVWFVALGAANATEADIFPWKIANTSVWLADASYCPSSLYLTKNYIGASEGFQALNIFSDEATDSHGFLGVMSSQNTIYIVFRGSTSTTNWVSDFDTELTPYSACQDCEVHLGFFDAYGKIRQQIVDAMTAIRQQYPDYQIVVTGHSLGGALATLAALDLISMGCTKVQLVNFGSPRVGEKNFAAYASSLLVDTLRITHYRDPAPHVPYHQRYEHIIGEWYEGKDGTVRPCVGNEDPKCSNQWYLTEFSDHMRYLQLSIGCKYVSSDLEQEQLLKMQYVDPPMPTNK